MRGEILFLAHRVPFPPDRGDKIRSHHLLKALAGIAPVHVGCLGETDDDMAQSDELAAIGASHFLSRRRKHVVAAGFAALATRRPVSLAAFDHAGLREWVVRTIAERPIGAVFVFSGQMGQYVPDDFEGRVVIDLCDVDSAKFEAYGAQGGGPRGWIDRREARLLAAEEERLAHRAHCTLLVSEAEAGLFRSRLRDPGGTRIAALRNGIDTARFDPQAVAPHPDLAPQGGPHLVFTGQMDYAPNVAAVLRVAERLLPAIRRVHPEAVFHVVGRAPVAQLRKLDGQDGIRVWGEVPDVRPFLASADLVLAPLEIARGIQNKVLEAMAMARAVVLSPEAATGIDARDGAHFTVGADDAALVERALDLLANAPSALTMGAAARRYVMDHQGWQAMLAPLARIVGGDAPVAQDRRNAA